MLLKQALGAQHVEEYFGPVLYDCPISAQELHSLITIAYVAVVYCLQRRMMERRKVLSNSH